MLYLLAAFLPTFNMTEVKIGSNISTLNLFQHGLQLIALEHMLILKFCRIFFCMFFFKLKMLPLINFKIELV
jgi:hypothetical protein